MWNKPPHCLVRQTLACFFFSLPVDEANEWLLLKQLVTILVITNKPILRFDVVLFTTQVRS